MGDSGGFRDPLVGMDCDPDEADRVEYVRRYERQIEREEAERDAREDERRP